MLDPAGPMDVYSFGLVLWEIWHETLPFNGDLKEAIEVVVQEDQRPAISEIGASQVIPEDDQLDEEEVKNQIEN
jgi:hypothetical protein